ncbi:MAG TPA: C40 family peptidase [Candidatus Eisenbergiella merdipullorum]|uniref:C40 family peptidase n=1 Tax=Candidatus Eisenbergiella merdipullorum TaxID=2838553 RepID=A0A9D2KZX1_9FIRM|nr:C40 family peptidase [Candidatus Eisenbergiella merdipullorum]
MIKGTKAIGLLAVSAVLWAGQTVPSSANTAASVPSAGVGQILEADLQEEDYLAAAEEAKNERKAIYGFSNLGVANVSNYLNVRKEPSEDGKLVGKMSKNSGCEVLDVEDGWAYIKSGKVTGYVKAEYLLTGKDARDRADEVATDMAVCNSGGLRVREEPSTESPVITLVAEGEELEVVEQLDGWVKIMLDDEEAYVSADYVNIAKKLDRAVTQTELIYGKGVSDIRVTLVNYAKQFLGNPYVWGGTSLTKGADCSGFVQSVFKNYGVSLPRTSAAQSTVGTKVSLSEAQPGDLVFYANNGRVNHVAIYIGNGQVIHASNPRSGIKISNASYRTPYAVKRVLSS